MKNMTIAKHAFFDASILGNYLPLAGGQMGGNIDMDGNNITMGGGLLNAEGGNIQMGAGWIGRAANCLSFDAGNNAVFANPIYLPDGAVGAPGWAFANAPTTGMYRIGGAVYFGVGGIGSFLYTNVYLGNFGGGALTTSSSATNPGVTCGSQDLDTGMTHPGSDQTGFCAGGTEMVRVTEDTNRTEFRTFGSIVRRVNDINITPYTVLQTDYYLQCRRTAVGILTVNLPSIATVGNGFVIIIKDSGYNANANNITVARNGADTINNVAGNYTMNVSGQCIMLIANATTDDWEIYN